MPRIKTAESIRRRGNTICPIDETIPARVVVRDCINKTYRVRRSSVVVEDPAPVEVAAEIVTDETTDAEYAAEAFKMVRVAKCWHTLTEPKSRRTIALLLAASYHWDRLTVGEKTEVFVSVTEWIANPDDFREWSCESLHRPGTFHQCSFVPETGELSCDCEAGRLNRDCHHVRAFWQVKVPGIKEQYHAGCARLHDAITELNTVGVDRAAESDCRQEHAESEGREVGFISCRSNDYNRGRIANQSATLINPKGDF